VCGPGLRLHRRDVWRLAADAGAPLLLHGRRPHPAPSGRPHHAAVDPGIVVRQEEQRIKGRDDEFPSFIRALGATEGAKQSTTSKVLKSLRKKDFGPLTENLDHLYKRLNMRIEARRRVALLHRRLSLIPHPDVLGDVPRRALDGGSPKMLGELIAKNMSEVQQLRKQRQQATVRFVGLLYGITAASTFAFFIGLQVVNILSRR